MPQLELPRPSVIRERIEAVKSERMRLYLMALYLFAARASELCGRVATCDLAKHRVAQVYGPTGDKVRVEPWQDETYPEIKAKVAVFEIMTAKRKPQGYLRNVGLPIDSDPWVPQLLDYWKAAGKGYVFPFNRYHADYYVKQNEVFKGLEYPIVKYKILGDAEPKIVEEHPHPLILHGLRHVRATELMERYNFNLEQVAVYGGWKIRTVQSVSPILVDRYLALGYRFYVGKLLRPL
jgi:integrase